MRRTIHINLLKRTERRSPLPVRFRVMVPLLSCLMVIVVLLTAVFLNLKRKALQTEIEDVVAKQDDLKNSHHEFSELKARERVAQMEIGQFESYLGGRLAYAPVLLELPHVVPLTMQLANLQITEPARVMISATQKKGSQARSKKQNEKMSERESVSLRLAGFVDSASTIDRLKKELLAKTFTNLIVDVEVPPGAFRASGGARTQYLFELSAACTERVFQ